MTADNHTGDILNALGKEMDNAVTEYIDRLELKTPHSIKKKTRSRKKTIILAAIIAALLLSGTAVLSNTKIFEGEDAASEIGSSMKESVQVLIRSEGKPLADKDIIGYINEVPVSKAYFNVRYNMFKLSGSETPAEDAWESLKLNAAEAEFAKEKNIYPTEKEIREEAAQQREIAESTEEASAIAHSLIENLGLTDDYYWEKYRPLYESPIMVTKGNINVYLNEHSLPPINSTAVNAVITDKETHVKYPLTDYSLTPTVAIIDPALTMTLPPSITANTGMDVLTHAIEAYVSVLASDFTDALAYKAVQMVFEYLPRAVHNGANDPEAREKMHNASAMAGMAFANAFLGMNHSMAHKVGAEFHVPHGLANAILLPYTIRYNGTKPEKPGIWPKYKYYNADERYCELAKAVGIEFSTVEEGVEKFAEAVTNLGKDVGIAMNFKSLDYLNEKDWMNAVEKLSYLAYEDQCSPANPRIPMVKDMQNILRESWTGKVITYKHH